MATRTSVIASIQAALDAANNLPLPVVTPTIWHVDLSSKAAIFAQSAIGAAGMGNMGIAGGVTGWAYNPEFLADSVTGMPYFRVSSDPANANQRLIDFRYLLPPGMQGDEQWDRYCIYIEPDVATGFNPAALGMKLTGGGNDYLTPAANPWFMLPMEFGSPNLTVSPVTMTLQTYWYSAESGSGFGKVEQTGKSLTAGRWHCVETHKKLNTPGIANGIAEVWLDNVLIWSRTNYLFRTVSTAFFQTYNVKYYGGGLAPPIGLYHCRIAHVDVSTTGRLGVPADLPAPPPIVTPPPTGTWPVWRNGKPKDVFFQIANTANMSGTTTNVGTVNAWNGFAAGPSTWYSAAQGGHGDSQENKVLALDLTVDAPAWKVLHPGSIIPATPINTAYYADGLPASRHGYYCSQYVASRNRIFLVSGAAVNTASLNIRNIDAFNVATKTWDPAGTHPLLSFTPVSTVSTVAQHPVTGDIYLANAGGFAKWTAATDSCANLNVAGGPQWQFHPSLIDASRNRWVYCDGTRMSFVNLTTLAVTALNITGGANSSDYSGLVYDTDNDRYLLLAGTTLWTINPTTGVSSALTTVPSAVNGTNGRLAFFAASGGVAYQPSFASNTLFMPTRDV